MEVLSARRLHSSTLVAAALIVSLIVALPTDANAQASAERFRYGISGNERVFTTAAEAAAGASIVLSVSGGTEARIIVELVDLFADESGSRRQLPLGTNPYSPEGLVRFPPVADTYVPDGGRQRFEIPFAFEGHEDVARPVLGGLRISLEPTATPGRGSGQTMTLASAIVATFAYFPVGSSLADADIRPGLAVGRIEGLPRIAFTSRSIPMTTEVRNTGDIFLEVATELVVRDARVPDGGPGRTLGSTAPVRALLVPNQTTRVEADLFTIASQDAPPGAWSRVRLLEVEVRSTGSLGGAFEVSDRTVRSVLVVPSDLVWTVVLLLTFVVNVVLALRVRSMRRRLTAGEEPVRSAGVAGAK